MGFDPRSESEGFDRSFELPYGQAELIRRVAGVTDDVVVVLHAGGNVEMESWIGEVGALLMAWYPGQEGSLAAAEILFGVTNPSGRLPASFARTLDEEPAAASYHDDDGDRRVTYDEGLFLGYRHWDRVDAEPRYPFGYGLSFTDFAMTELEVEPQRFGEGDEVRVRVRVENTGSAAGAEVVQLYVADAESGLPRPVQELKGFARVHLEPGESATVEMTLDERAFAFYDPEAAGWVVEPGDFEIRVGRSSRELAAMATIVRE